MNQQLSNFTARLRASIDSGFQNKNFDALALELFALQFEDNFAYRKICEARKLTPQKIEHWTQIPFMPTGAFKELDLTSLAPDERTAVFHSSGTTGQTSSRHFHSKESLEIYEAASWRWFETNVLRSADGSSAGSETETRGQADRTPMILTPPPALAPHSSLVHMFETVRQNLNFDEPVFVGKIGGDNSWVLDFGRALKMLRGSAGQNRPLVLLGTAFSFVHLLDFLEEKNLRLQLPENSRVMETGGYKNRSRSLQKAELHSLITKFLGVSRENIICEYGMSELSSQAYDLGIQNESRAFHFPKWARAQIVSLETGREVRDGETGLVRVFDLANVFSVAAIQTEDLGIRRADRFELIGRAKFSEPRGCSLMTA